MKVRPDGSFSSGAPKKFVQKVHHFASEIKGLRRGPWSRDLD